MNSSPAEIPSFFAKAARALQEGRLDAARKHCGKALKAEGDRFEVLQLAGVIELTQQHWAEAARHLEQACKQRPGRPEALAQLAFAYKNGGRASDAMAALRRALDVQPDNVQLRCELGRLAADTGDYDAAYEAFSAAHARVPREPAILYFLGLTDFSRGRHARAVEWLRQAWMLNPAHAQTGVTLGRSYAELGLREEAVSAWRQAIAADARCAAAYLDLANFLDDAGRRDEALQVYEAGAAAAPDQAVLACALAEEYEHRNRLDDAARAVTQALATAPDDLHANVLAARLARRAGKPVEGLARLARFASIDERAPRAEEILFELGLLSDRAGETEQALRYAERANHIQLAGHPHIDKQTVLAEIARLRAAPAGAWSAEVDAAHAGDWPPDPIFLVGFPRSGTTLLGRMLKAHSRLDLLEETPLTEQLAQSAREAPGGYPDGVGSVGAAVIDGWRKAYWRSAARLGAASPARGLIDKAPLALIHAGLLHHVFPRSRFIFALRHPCDAVLSCVLQRFELNPAMANFGNLRDSVGFYAAAMGLWEHYRAHLPLLVHCLHYERLIEQPETELRGLLDFLGLEWEPAMLDVAARSGTEETINTPSYQQVAEPLYTRARYRWERYRQFYDKGTLAALAPFAERYGYEL